MFESEYLFWQYRGEGYYSRGGWERGQYGQGFKAGARRANRRHFFDTQHLEALVMNADYDRDTAKRVAEVLGNVVHDERSRAGAAERLAAELKAKEAATYEALQGVRRERDIARLALQEMRRQRNESRTRADAAERERDEVRGVIHSESVKVTIHNGLGGTLECDGKIDPSLHHGWQAHGARGAD